MRRTFAMQSFWTILIGIAMFGATLPPIAILEKALALGSVWVAVLSVVWRKEFVALCSTEETKPNELRPNEMEKTGRIIQPGEDYTERAVIVVCLGAVFFALLVLAEPLRTIALVCAAMCAVSAVATKRAYDDGERDVSGTQREVFYSLPVIVSVSLFGAYAAGVSVWFVIGFAVLTAAYHMRYGIVLDRMEAKAAKAKVVELKSVQSA